MPPEQEELYLNLLSKSTYSVADSHYDYDRKLPGYFYDSSQDRFFKINTDLSNEHIMNVKATDLANVLHNTCISKPNVYDFVTKCEYGLNSESPLDYLLKYTKSLKKQTISGIRATKPVFQTFMSPRGDLLMHFDNSHLMFYVVDENLGLDPFTPLDFRYLGNYIADVCFVEGPLYNVAILLRVDWVVLQLDTANLRIVDFNVVSFPSSAHSMSWMNKYALAYSDYVQIIDGNDNLGVKIKFGANGVCFKDDNVLCGVRSKDRSAVLYDVRAQKWSCRKLRGLTSSLHYQLEKVGDHLVMCGCHSQLVLYDTRNQSRILSTFEGHGSCMGKGAVFEYNSLFDAVCAVDEFGFVRMWNGRGGSSIFVLPPPSVDSFMSVHFRNVIGNVRCVPKLCIFSTNGCIYYSL